MSSRSKKKRIRIKYVKSAIGYSRRQKMTVRALGLRRLQDVVEHDDSPTLRGMLGRISHLVEVEEVGKR